jgi:hypothetical protein
MCPQRLRGARREGEERGLGEGKKRTIRGKDGVRRED